MCITVLYILYVFINVLYNVFLFSIGKLILYILVCSLCTVSGFIHLQLFLIHNEKLNCYLKYLFNCIAVSEPQSFTYKYFYWVSMSTSVWVGNFTYELLSLQQYSAPSLSSQVGGGGSLTKLNCLCAMKVRDLAMLPVRCLDHKTG